MASKQQKAAEDPRKSAATTETNISVAQAAEDGTKRARRRVEDDDELLTVIIPHPFKLHHPPGVVTPYDSGTQDMPRSHAEHPYSKDNGVTIYKGRK